MSEFVPDRAADRHKIVSGALEGRQTAFEELYFYLSPLKAFFRRKAPYHDAEDLFQDTMLAVIGGLREGRLRCAEALPSYAQAIARNKLAAYYEQRQRTELLQPGKWDVLATTAASAESRVIAEEQWQVALRILRSLPVRDREVLIRFYLEGHSAAQIQEEMGLSETQFRLLKSRAKSRFQDLCAARFARRNRPGVAPCLVAHAGGTAA